MKKVVTHPERCVGCMQCMLACAVAHSKSKSLFAATLEQPRPRPRIHVGKGRSNEGFPNRCRHCDPAPCRIACLPGAIFRAEDTGTVLIDPDRCINCGSCAMACPFGVLRFHEDYTAPPKKQVAVKCDNCDQRVAQGLVPACVEACMPGALTFEDMDVALKRKTNQVAATAVSSAEDAVSPSPGFNLLRSVKTAEVRIARR